MKHILCIVSVMNAGGAETFLMKILRNIDRTQYMLDFCVNREKNFYQKEIESLGGKIYIVEPKSKNFYKYLKELYFLIKNNNYDYVIRVNQHSLATIDLIIAKLAGANNLIMRSSNAASGSKKNELLHKIFKFLPRFIPNIKLAPSKKAAEYTFGKGCIERGEAFILPNALNIEDYTFSNKEREKYRKELGVEDNLVIGHVGRFSPQKNHKFLLEVFADLLKKEPKAILLLIGNGTLREAIEKQAKKLRIEKSIKFLGVRKDVNKLLNAFDLFIFPSFFEGMPNTIIEAQTNGVPCLLADTITSEVEITKSVKRISLKLTADEWSNKAIELYKNSIVNDRTENAIIMRENKYDIKDIVEVFVEKVFNT